MEKSALLGLFVQYILPVLATAIASGLTWVLAQLALKIQAEWSQSKWGAAMTQLALLAKSAVAEVEATLRPLIKEAAADGSISKEEAEKLKKAAIDKLVEMAKVQGFEEARKLLETLAPPVLALVGGFIESAVSAQRVDGRAATVNP
ncbi:MAG: hypothetical protein ACREXY_13865 [Gammaproteobacteria bacterium]